MIKCVKCGGETANCEYSGIKFEICKNCNSVLITKENFELLCRKIDETCEIIDLMSLPAIKAKKDNYNCNACESPMEKTLHNGIIIDRCRKCNTLLFDNGELSKFFAKFSKKPIEISGNAKFIKIVCDNNKTVEQELHKTQQPLKFQSKIVERTAKHSDGWAMLGILVFVTLLTILLFIIACAAQTPVLFAIPILLIIALIFLCGGFRTIQPQEALVLTLFGEYVGTIKQAGFYWINPFCSSCPTFATISTKARTLDNPKQKINDALGNPIEIGIMVTWEIFDTAKAVFSVENYSSFLSAQCDSALRNITRLYPYDAPEDSNKVSLRGDSAEIAVKLKEEIQNNVIGAGIRVLDARITHLAYSPEIAAAMLQRQQANAVIDAKRALVDGAVGMVEMAIDKLSGNKNITLDDKTKTQMVNNLLVVLCGNKESQPVLRSDKL